MIVKTEIGYTKTSWKSFDEIVSWAKGNNYPVVKTKDKVIVILPENSLEKNENELILVYEEGG